MGNRVYRGLYRGLYTHIKRETDGVDEMSECDHKDAVKWNPFNKAIQCHKCGETFEGVDALRALVGSTTKVSINFEDLNLCLFSSLFVGSDSQLNPIHRLNVHDSKGNTLLLQLDKSRLFQRMIEE